MHEAEVLAGHATEWTDNVWHWMWEVRKRVCVLVCTHFYIQYSKNLTAVQMKPYGELHRINW